MFDWFIAFLTDYLNTVSPAELLVLVLIIVVIAGLIGGMIARKLNQPLLLGYILAGVFVGLAYKALLGSSGNAALDSLANIGVALLLFSMGLEFKKKDLAPIRNVAVWGTLSQVAFTFLAGAGIAWGLSRFTEGWFSSVISMFIFATAFVSTSTAVVLKTLASRGQMGTLSSKVMIGMSIVQDLTVIPLFMLLTKLGNLSDGWYAAAQPLIFGAVFMLLMMTVGAKYLPYVLRWGAMTNAKELFLLAVTALALGAGALADVMQVSFSFGAFLAGIALSESEYGKKAIGELMPVRDLFAMIFFVSIGMMLDCHFLVNNIGMVLIVMLATSFSRTGFLAITTWCSGYRNVIPVAMFFGMFATSEIAFVVIQLGKDGGFFTNEVYSLILCAVVCSMIIGPLMDCLTSPVYSILKKTIWKNSFHNNIAVPPPALSGHIIVAGGENMGRSIAKLMKGLKLPYILIEPVYSEYEKAVRNNVHCLFGEPHQQVILESAGVTRAKLLLAASSAFPDNYAVIRQAQKMNPALQIVARSNNAEELEMLRKCENVFEIIQPKFEAGLEMTRQALLCLNVSALDIQNYMDNVRFSHYQALNEGISGNSLAKSMRSFAGLVELSWVKLPGECSCGVAGRSIADSRIRSKTGVSIVCIMRDEGKEIYTNPSPDFVLQKDDVLALIGTREQCEKFETICGINLSGTPAGAEQIANR